jgi:outer membrane scaffolding protein for murein synthesis (MipA/OmpV family)
MGRDMSRWLFVVPVLLSLAGAAAAEEPSSEPGMPSARNLPVPSDWSVTVGGGALVAPSYPGAASWRVLPLPFLDVQYRQMFFLSPIAGLGMAVPIASRVRLALAMLPDFGRSASSADRLRGWGGIGAGASTKLSAMYLLGPLTLLADVRHQLGAANGTLVDVGASKTFPVARRLLLSAIATLSWADARYMRAYFGVDPGQSTIALGQGVTLPNYSAGAGLRDGTLSLLSIVPLDEHWSLQGIVRTEFLLGDIAASPVIERRLQAMFGGFTAYRF